jgi:hypothetical protein
MNAAKHTPGPWHVSSMTSTNGIFDAYGNPVARTSVLNGELTRKRRLADAQLIASAPDMLAALQAFQLAWDNDRKVTIDEAAAIRAAIAKATGDYK